MLVNVFAPLYCRKPDEKFAETLKQTEFTSDTPGGERIRCIDDNEEALLWRLRMIGAAKKSIVLATFDLRADESGTDLLAALDHAAEKGVEIKLLIDGIYQQLFLNGSKEFQALASRENVEVGVYNPVSPVGLFKLNYRMHDKYVIVDDKMVAATAMIFSLEIIPQISMWIGIFWYAIQQMERVNPCRNWKHIFSRFGMKIA